MEHELYHQHHSLDLPQVLVLKPPAFFKYLEDQLVNKFPLLKAWESPLSQDKFLKPHAHSVQAMICLACVSAYAAILQLLPALHLIVTDSAGLNAGNIFSKDGAEMTVGLLIDVLRKISAADQYVRQGHCDVLIICCGLTDQTRNMVSKEVVMVFGKEGVITKIGCGPIIDEKAVVRCLLDGEINGAGLDVFGNEPNVPNELFELDNVVLSPHRAVFTEESF
ncbi:unnamed protein product [Dovyalis caffra]|uniref:D-isomer specific 2-hydroxyacid dehydrogenase NAD-binding domain-containing protein n=1 Tax=Dovyalis caffra TaxID=77055 RepID=A0AAV1S974_9ROSI|nr:unnamed protein product [Dovyalis caffra]